jgi:glycosyltransferase involved in cell wall biosynthesis
MSEEKKVLIVTYYWPPSGGSGVQRWLKFVKYLPQFGYTPYVFTPENPSFELRDESLLKDVPNEAEVIRLPIWEPYNMFYKASKILGKAKEQKTTNVVSTNGKSLFQKFTTWLRGNIIIPDPRVFWVRPATQFLHDFLKDKQINTIITTGPPHSIHLIGLRLKKKNPSLKWIADFRDPWSEWGFLDSLMVGGVARSIHKRLEKSVLRNADRIVTITPFYVRKFSALAGKNVALLTNGFDEEDFKGLALEKTKKFTIRHVGIVNEKCNPRPFMLALKELILEHEEFHAAVHVDFVGDVHADFRSFVLLDTHLENVTSFTSPVPHKQLIGLYNKSALLLLILTGYKDAEGYMPGKLFEYIATGLPVLGVGPVNGDAGNLIRLADCGQMIESENKDQIKQFLMTAFGEWKSNVTLGKKSNQSMNFSRRGVTAQLVKILDE